MRLHRILALSALASVAFTAAATAEEALHLTPPLYREQARATQSVRSVNDLTTTPHPVVGSPASARIIARQASADTAR